jgi:hypothetical protein
MPFLMVIALIWLVPLAIILVMVLGSLISSRFRRACVEQLFGGEDSQHSAVRRLTDMAMPPDG